MRISDWSSDVCSSDLRGLNGRARNRQIDVRIGRGERSARWLSIAPKLTKFTVRPGARRGKVRRRVGQDVRLRWGLAWREGRARGGQRASDAERNSVIWE